MSYSHSTPPADLQRCADAPRSSVVPVDTSATKRPWSVQDRIDEHTRADMIAAYRAGTTATFARDHARAQPEERQAPADLRWSPPQATACVTARARPGRAIGGRSGCAD